MNTATLDPRALVFLPEDLEFVKAFAALDHDKRILARGVILGLGMGCVPTSSPAASDPGR